MNDRSSAEPLTAVAKALAVLRAFVDGQNEWGVRELATALGYPPTTMHRLLMRLRTEGYLAYDETEQKYKIGFEFSRMTAAVTQRDGFRQAALPVMRDLAGEAGESVWLALYDNEQKRIAYIAESESPHASRYSASLGRARMLDESACGLAILATLPQAESLEAVHAGKRAAIKQTIEHIDAARRDGYAILRANEVGSGIMIAAAILGPNGRAIGSLGIVVPTHRYGTGQDRYLGRYVKAAADRVSSRLGAKLLGGASTGTWHDAIGLIGELLRRQAPHLSIATALGGGSRNLESISRGEGAYGLTTASSAYDARNGRPPFAKRSRGLRAVMHLSELHLFVITHADRQLQGAADLAHLRVSPGEQGYSARRAFQDLLHCTRDDKAARRKQAAGSEFYMDYAEGKQQFEARTVDALVWLSGVTNPLVQALESSGMTRLHGLDEATIEAMLALNPGYRQGRLSQDAFPAWLARDTPTLMVPTMLVCHADRPDEEVYQITKGLYENRETLSQLSSVYRRIDIDFAIKDLTVPIHPGADLYFRELGGTPSFRRTGL